MSYNLLEPGEYQIKMVSSIGGMGQIKVYSYLRDLLFENEEREEIVDIIVDKVGWEWTSKYGNWTKRMAKALKKQKIIFSGNFLSRVGRIAKDDCIGDRTFIIYVDKIKEPYMWEEGIYGDDDSCFYTCRSAAWWCLMQNGGMAVRFHDENDQPIGRCFAFNRKPGIILFNGYSVCGSNISLLQMARLVMEITNNIYYEKIRVSNGDCNDGVLWINGGRIERKESSKNAYLVGDLTTQKHESIDINAPYHCRDCGEDLYRNLYLEILNWVDNNNMDGEWTCYDCYRKIAFCSGCGMKHKKSEMAYVPSQNSWFCNNCTPSHIVLTDCCNIWELRENVICLEDGTKICKQCHQKYYCICERCGRMVHKNKTHHFKDGIYCQECVDRHSLIDCEWCGEKLYRGYNFEGKIYCYFHFNLKVRYRESLLRRRFHLSSICTVCKRKITEWDQVWIGTKMACRYCASKTRLCWFCGDTMLESKKIALVETIKVPVYLKGKGLPYTYGKIHIIQLMSCPSCYAEYERSLHKILFRQFKENPLKEILERKFTPITQQDNHIPMWRYGT